MDADASIPRCAVVWLVVTASVAGLLACLAGDVVRTVGLISSGRLAAAPFDQLLALLAALALVACGLWFWLVTTLITVEAALGATAHTSRLARASCPEGLRRLLLAACGLALASGLVTPATAVEGRAPVPSPDAATLVGLPLPDRATVVAAPATLAVIATAEGNDPTERMRRAPDPPLTRPGPYGCGPATRCGAWRRRRCPPMPATQTSPRPAERSTTTTGASSAATPT